MYNKEKKRRLSSRRLLGVGLGLMVWGAAAFAFTGCSWSRMNARVPQSASAPQDDGSAADADCSLPEAESAADADCSLPEAESAADVDCSLPEAESNEAAGEKKDEYESTEEENGGDEMTREFVEVALVAEDHFMLEDTKGRFYWIDIKYNENYAEGDLLCLVYRDKVKLEEDCWKVEPQLLYVNDNRVDIPQF